MIRQLVDTYYNGITSRSGWEASLADGVRFVGPGGSSTTGKQAYIEGTNQFLHAVTSATRKETLFDGDTACVWMRYDLRSPSGQTGALDALEIWNGGDEGLEQLTLYFDRSAFQALMQA